MRIVDAESSELAASLSQSQAELFRDDATFFEISHQLPSLKNLMREPNRLQLAVFMGCYRHKGENPRAGVKCVAERRCLECALI